MLSRANRLNKQKDFEAVFKQGKTKQDKFFVIRAILNDQKKSRFGLVVSAKVSKKAVERNLLRRRLGEIVRKFPKNVKSGLDIIIIAKSGAAEMEYKKIEDSLEKLLVASGIYG